MTPPSPAPGAGSTPPGTTALPTPENSALLTVWVPYDAKVVVNGLETRSVGSRRQFVSYGLTPGCSYKYVIVAQVTREEKGPNGEIQQKVQEDNREVILTAGARTSVAFGFNPKPNQELALVP